MFVIFMIEETENIRAVAEMKKEGKHLRGRQRLRWGGGTLRKDTKAWNTGEEWATDKRHRGKICYLVQKEGRW